MQKIACPLRIHCTEEFVPSFSFKVVLGTLAALFTTVFLRGNSEYQLVDNIFHIIPQALCGLFQTWVIQSVVKLRYNSYLTTRILTTSAWVQQAQWYYEAPENRDYLTLKHFSQKYQVFESGTKMLLWKCQSWSFKLKSIPWHLYK